jgi:hypothetical protein
VLLTGTALVITVLFNQAYTNADINRYYLGPILIVWTWMGVLAAEVAAVGGFVMARAVAAVRRAHLDDRLLERASIAAALVVGLALLTPSLTDLGARRAAPGVDRSHERDAEDWLAEVLRVLPQNAVLVSWWSTSTPLWYAQYVEGLRTDVFVVDDRTMLDLGLGRAPDVIRRYLDEGRPVYAIRLEGPDLDELRGQFAMTQVAGGGSVAVWAVQGILAASR